jgi:hypothetical protein
MKVGGHPTGRGTTVSTSLAAGWCEPDGQLEAALRNVPDAEDIDRVARIAITLAQLMYAAGHAGTVLSWLEWLDERRAVERWSRGQRAGSRWRSWCRACPVIPHG